MICLFIFSQSKNVWDDWICFLCCCVLAMVFNYDCLFLKRGDSSLEETVLIKSKDSVLFSIPVDEWTGSIIIIDGEIFFKMEPPERPLYVVYRHSPNLAKKTCQTWNLKTITAQQPLRCGNYIDTYDTYEVIS